jgi:hypothetical protein
MVLRRHNTTIRHFRTLNQVALTSLQFYNFMNVVIMNRREVNILGDVQLRKCSYHILENPSPFQNLKFEDTNTQISQVHLFPSGSIYFYFWCIISIYIYTYIYTYIYMCGFKTSGDAFRLPYSIAFSCSIHPFLDLFHSWLYISHLSRSFGNGLVSSFLHVSVNHDFW